MPPQEGARRAAEKALKIRLRTFSPLTFAGDARRNKRNVGALLKTNENLRTGRGRQADMRLAADTVGD